MNPTTTTQTNPIVVSATPATNQYNQYTSQLNGYLSALNNTPNNANPAAPATTDNPAGTATISNTNDAYTQTLDNVSKTSSAATQALINSIQAQRATQQNTTDAQYNNYKGALQQLGIQHNEAQFSPDLLTSHINAVESAHQEKLNSIQTEMNKAMLDAESAQQKNDLSTLKDKMTYIDTLNKQRQDYLKNIADNLTATSKINDTYAGQIYDNLQNLSPNEQEAYIQAVAQKYASQGVSLDGLAKSLASIKAARAVADTEAKTKQADLAKTLSETEIAKNKAPIDLAKGKADIAQTQAQTAKIYNDIKTGKITQKEGTVIENITQSLASDTPEYIASLNGKSSQRPLDTNGYLKPDAFQHILENSGLTRAKVLENFANYLYPDDYKAYKLTPAEIKKVTGALPTTG